MSEENTCQINGRIKGTVRGTYSCCRTCFRHWATRPANVERRENECRAKVERARANVLVLMDSASQQQPFTWQSVNSVSDHRQCGHQRAIRCDWKRMPRQKSSVRSVIAKKAKFAKDQTNRLQIVHLSSSAQESMRFHCQLQIVLFRGRTLSVC